MEATMDDIIEKLKKLKGNGQEETSPLDDFFKEKIKDLEAEEEKSETTENDLDIKPLGKTKKKNSTTVNTNEEIVTEKSVPNRDNVLSKGIRELSMDDLENFPEETDATENDVETIEIKTTNPQKVKLLKLIVALLEAEQYEAAYREIEKLKTI